MKIFMNKHRSTVTFIVALLAALYSHFVEPIPGVDQEVWTAVLGVTGTYSLIKLKGKLSFFEMLSLLRDAKAIRKGYNDTADSSVGDDDKKGSK